MSNRTEKLRILEKTELMTYYATKIKERVIDDKLSELLASLIIDCSSDIEHIAITEERSDSIKCKSIKQFINKKLEQLKNLL